MGEWAKHGRMHWWIDGWVGDGGERITVLILISDFWFQLKSNDGISIYDIKQSNKTNNKKNKRKKRKRKAEHTGARIIKGGGDGLDGWLLPLLLLVLSDTRRGVYITSVSSVISHQFHPVSNNNKGTKTHTGAYNPWLCALAPAPTPAPLIIACPACASVYPCATCEWPCWCWCWCWCVWGDVGVFWFWCWFWALRERALRSCLVLFCFVSWCV